MTIVHKASLHNNPRIKINNQGGHLTADAGLLLVAEYLDHLGFTKWLSELVHFKDARKFNRYSSLALTQQILFQLIAGYQYDSAANTLQTDPGLTLILKQRKLASQPTISRFLGRMTESNITELNQLLCRLADTVLQKKNQQDMIIDVDSTHSDTFGQQENARYNAHYQVDGYHPLMAFDSLTGMLLATKLRAGNVYTSNGTRDFLEPILNHYRNDSCDMNILVRGDSGFAIPELYHLCVQQKCYFLVKLKANSRLHKLAEQVVRYGERSLMSAETQYYELTYQPNTWQQSYRVVVKATRAAGELLFHYEFLVTNLSEPLIEDLYRTYHQRGVVENSIKEAKDGFFLDKTDSHKFRTNAIRMLLSAVAYNIVQSMKCLVLPATESCQLIGTLRFKLFRVPAQIVRHAHNIIIKLSSTNVFDNLFWQVLHRIQQT